MTIEEIEKCLSEIEYDEKKMLKDNKAFFAYHKLLSNSKVWIEFLLSRIKELEEGIERHSKTSMEGCHYWVQWDIELYKLIEK